MPTRIELADIARTLDTVGHGGRTAYVERQAKFYGIATQTLLAQLKREVGWQSGRKARADKGSTRADGAVMKIAATMGREGVRKNGKSTMRLTTTVGVLSSNGLKAGVSVDQLQRLLRARKLDRASQTAASPHITLRATHPNHVHQVDPSLCVVYYLRGEQYIMREDVFYKNKEHKFAEVQFKVWRYTAWDKASSAIKVRYVEAKGETQINLAEFILWVWATGDGHAFYGVPDILALDKGSANTAHAIKALCEALDVEVTDHRAGNARAHGGVEGAQNIVETQFESRLRFEPVESVEQLNVAAAFWYVAWNENLIADQDCRLTRRGRVIGARADLWRYITAEQLRLLPDIAVCRALMEGKTIERKVKGDLTIGFRHPASKVVRHYSVKGIDGVSAGDVVRVSPLVYGDCSIRVRVAIYNGEDAIHRIEPEAALDRYGQPEDAPVWGEEYRRMPDTVADKRAKELDALAYPGLDEEGIRKARAANKTPLLGVLDGKNLTAHSHLKNIVAPTTLRKRGELVDVPDYVTPVPVKPLSHFAACKVIATQLGRPLTDDENAQVRSWYPDGVPEDTVSMVAACVSNGTTPFNVARPALRAVS